jgi:hypothetical protein
MYDKFKNLKPIKDPKVRRKLKSLLIERKKLLEKREVERNKQIKEQLKMHNKYLPKYLSPKILNAIGFIEYTKQRGELDMPGMTRFLMEEKNLSSKEMGWVLLLLSFDAIEEILATPEVGGMIKDAIQKSRGTIH